MLKVSIHAGSFADCSTFNRLAVLDIVYAQLKPVADYKITLQERQRDVLPPRILSGYPRWSASLWDLTARVLAVALPDVLPTTEAVPEVAPPLKKQRPSAEEISVVLEHIAGNRRSTLGTVAIQQAGRKRGVYEAHFEEHTMKPYRTGTFEYLPEYFRPTELLLHACAHRLTNTAALPARPGLCLPPPITVNAHEYVAIHQLLEPARTGFQLWLKDHSEQPLAHPDVPLGLAPMPIYKHFLSSAI